jgi:DNA-binding NtrC family response regulator
VVDDDQAIRWTLHEALQSWGFESTEASSVAEGLAQFKADLPAAVLLDIDLPDGSGLDVLRDIKHEQPETIVIMITGNVHVSNTISALRGGAYDFIGKPIAVNAVKNDAVITSDGRSLNFDLLMLLPPFKGLRLRHTW